MMGWLRETPNEKAERLDAEQRERERIESLSDTQIVMEMLVELDDHGVLHPYEGNVKKRTGKPRWRWEEQL